MQTYPICSGNCNQGRAPCDCNPLRQEDGGETVDLPLVDVTEAEGWAIYVAVVITVIACVAAVAAGLI